MVQLSEIDLRTLSRKSSKGNQYKWEKDNVWYKADYAGYEGLAEYVVSSLLRFSTMNSNEFISYLTEEIQFKKHVYRGCKSKNFKPSSDWQIITLERLFENEYGESLYKSIFKIEDVKCRIEFLVNEIKKITGLEFGEYLCKCFAVDALFLNEDRHTHNLAVLMNSYQEFMFCPIFDNGASLLSDIYQDYSMDEDTYNLIDQVHSKTVSANFDEQVNAAEELYGQPLKFFFNLEDVKKILDDEPYYPKEYKDRAYEIIKERMRKYQYLFIEK